MKSISMEKEIVVCGDTPAAHRMGFGVLLPGGQRAGTVRMGTFSHAMGLSLEILEQRRTMVS
jgi:hypothetical protein